LLPIISLIKSFTSGGENINMTFLSSYYKV